MCFGDVDKIATNQTVKLVEKIIDVKKEEFLKNQELLNNHMNKGFGLMMKNDFKCSSMVMGIGNSGSGKSTTLNVIHGNNFETRQETNDVTTQLSEPTQSEKHLDTKVIDSVGFTPNLENFCKLILIFFQRGFFPDYFLYPSSHDRVVEILSLFRMVKFGYVKIMIAPFSAKSFYLIKSTIKKFCPTSSESENKKKALEESFNVEMVPKIVEELKKIKLKKNETLKGKVAIVSSLDKVPEIIGSMKMDFLKEFFIGGKFIDSITYEQVRDNSLNDDPESTKIFLYGLLVNAIKNLPHFSTYDSKGTLTGIDECQFLKDNPTIV
ncbi:hypothetical protein ACTFIV_002426 [Dictyostelium citrinum]